MSRRFSPLLTISLVVAAGAPALAYADTCASYYSETPKLSAENTADGGATRIVRDYHGHRVFAITINEPIDGYIPGTDGTSYRLQVTLNGKTALIDGLESCTTMMAAGYGDSCDWQNSGESLGTLTSGLFFYAAYGDHLNAWDVEVHAVRKDGSVDPVGKKYRFPQVAFTSLSWE
jgi:hypothetical protein